MISGVGQHILNAVGNPSGNPCADLRAAWNAFGRQSSSTWHGHYNSWAAELGCGSFNTVPPSGLSPNDRADIAALRTGTPTKISVAPPPKGGPPEKFTPITSEVPNEPPGEEDIFDDIDKVQQWVDTVGQVFSLCIEHDEEMRLDGAMANATLDARFVSLKGKDPAVHAIATLIRPVCLRDGGTSECLGWAAYKNGAWRLFIGRKVLLSCANWAARDKQVTPNLLRYDGFVGQVPADQRPTGGSSGTPTPPTPRPTPDIAPFPTSGGEPLPGLMDILGPGIAPRTVQRRICPSQGGIKMRLAYNGQCYPEEMLPEKWYFSRPKRAPVSWTAAQNIKKGRAAQKKIKGYAKRADLLPEHHHEHHVVHHRRRHR